MADDLCDLVNALQTGDVRFVLVGHSLGGLLVRMQASQTPDQIAGLVLVDPVSPEMATLHKKSYPLLLRALDRVATGLAAVGIAQWYAGYLADRLFTPQYAAEFKRYESTLPATKNRARENKGWLTSLATTDSTEIQLPNIPVTVLTSTHSTRFTAQSRQAYLASHRQLVANNPLRRQILVDAGHSIHLHNPAVVVDAIRQSVEASAIRHQP